MKRVWPKDYPLGPLLDSSQSVEKQVGEVFRSIDDTLQGENVTLCSLEGQLVWPLEISMGRYETLLPGRNVVAGTLFCGIEGVALHVT